MTKKIKSAIPIYLAALIWLIYGMIFPLYKLNHILACTAISIVIYVFTSYLFPGRTVTVEQKIETGNSELDQQLAAARATLHKLHQDNEAIPDAEITNKLNRMEEVGLKILDRVAERPAEAGNVRKFMNYYLPTAEKLLTHYARLAGTGVSGTQISGSLTSIENSLDMIVKAFEKQLDSLYKEEYLDITTDIEVLETMMKGDNLA